MNIYLIEFEYKEKNWSKIFIFKMNWFLKIFIREYVWFDMWFREIEKLWFFLKIILNF